MRAAVLRSIDDNEIVIRDDVELLAPGPGQVRVKIKAAGICHSDLSARRGDLPQPVPAILGHEAAGEVIEVGEDIADLSVGDRVILNWMSSCGRCASCRRGEPHLCLNHLMRAYSRPQFRLDGAPVFGLSGIGGFAEETVLSRGGVVKIDDDVPYEIAALIGCGVMTGVGAVLNTAKVTPGSTVVVIGCGGVGLSAVQGARIAGAGAIVAVDTVPAKLETAKRFGATHAAGPAGLSDIAEAVTGGEGFDYAFEAAGSPQAIRSAWGAARRGGTVVVVGAGRMDEVVEFSPFELMFDAKTLVGSLFGSANPKLDYPRLLELWREGRLDLVGMISHRIRLEDVNAALGALGRGDVIRQVIIYD
ncbi:alcohol dehydrogenase [Rhizocola hellebori]|uniref:Alcohol dehydrogenase n=1 Tax=Rhizocola hellebori TaxID=1392758 RepID=A0A8J3VGC2_9ACTN|nr:Zn-dependent alcohol dehydrogenase [Rhizocola hellebori]GIH06204.1 alcohol dehydrogenase [Rhizocola hellebori]